MKLSQSDIIHFATNPVILEVNALNVVNVTLVEKQVILPNFAQIIRTSFNVASFENTDPNFRPVQRSMVNVEIGGKDVELSYDIGSEFLIITKQIFDSL